MAPINDSTVNRIRSIIPKTNLNFSAQQLGKFDWRMLVSTTIIPTNDISQKIIDTYKDISSRMNFRFNNETDATNKVYLCQQLKEKLLTIHPDVNFVVDVLVKHLFYQVKSRRKVVFWECFGEEVVKNLRKNVDQNTKMCAVCGKRFYRSSPRQVNCDVCSAKQRRTYKTTKQKEYRQKGKMTEPDTNSFE